MPGGISGRPDAASRRRIGSHRSASRPERAAAIIALAGLGGLTAIGSVGLLAVWLATR